MRKLLKQWETSLKKKTDDIYKLLAMWKERIQVINIMNEMGDVTKEPADVHRAFREYCEQFHSHKFDNVREMDQ